MRAIWGEIVAEKRAVWRVGGDRGQHRIEVLGEAHVEHLVGLVEHDELDGIEVQAAPGQVVDRASRRRDDQVDAAPQAAQLLADRLPAVHRQHADARRPPVAVDRLGHLHRELARRHEDEPANPPVAAIVPSDPVDRRKGEGRRLARARRRFGEDVAALEERRDRLALDRRRLLVTQLAERGDELTADPQREEFGLSGGCGWLGAIRDWAVGHVPILSPIALSGTGDALAIPVTSCMTGRNAWLSYWFRREALRLAAPVHDAGDSPCRSHRYPDTRRRWRSSPAHLSSSRDW